MKTERFGNACYIGDPLNIVEIFNEKEADEICILISVLRQKTRLQILI